VAKMDTAVHCGCALYPPVGQTCGVAGSGLIAQSRSNTKGYMRGCC
jgi:hypothetical protein